MEISNVLIQQLSREIDSEELDEQMLYTLPSD
jgi:hypothetical protein